MSEMKDYKPGTFCWSELVALDSDKAKEFYTKLFGWSIVDVPIGDDKVYSMASIDGKNVAALYEMWPEQTENGVPTHWGSYVSVADIEEAVKKVKALGGEIIVGPMDVFDAGRMASFVDPTGALLSLWQPMDHIGAQLVNQHGALCWNELLTDDTGKAGAFYSGLFGWNAHEQDMGGMIYTVFMNDDKHAGGMIMMDKTCGDVPPNWLVYFAVNDCDSSVASAESMGGETLRAPMGIPGVGRFAILKDSQGAVFAIIKLVQM